MVAQQSGHSFNDAESELVGDGVAVLVLDCGDVGEAEETVEG